jgi:PAS domain S-box-containing protein
VNRADCAITGYSEDELCKLNVRNLAHPEDLPAIQDYMLRILTGKLHDYGRQKRCITKAGELICVQISVSAMHDGEGALIGLVTLIEDITAWAEAERTPNDRTTFLNLAHDAIIVRDLEDRIQYWNHGTQDTYGWSAKNVLGQITHELLKTTSPIARKVIETAVLETGGWEGELHHIWKDGQEVVVTSRWSLQRDENGAPKAFLEINRDITKGMRAEKEIRRLSGILLQLQDEER